MNKAKDNNIVRRSKETELTEEKEFVPTPSMIVWLDNAVELATDSPTAIAKASNLTKQTWYKWLKQDGFEDWYYENYKRKRRRWLPTLDKIGMQNAKRDYNYWKDMNKKVGDIQDDKPNVQVNVLNQIKKDKAKFDI